jgi:murein DD-endopeptidase MepM/ murein hydrolase activator NlpD
MVFTAKKIYWGIGIGVGLAGIAILIFRHRRGISKTVEQVEQKIEGWLKPVKAKISSPFGYRTNPVTKEKQFHNGIDLPVPVGTSVKSPMEGTVENVYFNALGGNQLIVKHSNGFTTGYAHLSKATVKKGDKVKKGQELALSGNTGRSTGPHVHFTMKDAKGNYLDPAKIVFAVA